MDVWHYFEVAAAVANRQDDTRTHRIGAVGLRSDGVMVAAYNGTAEYKRPRVHAEVRLCRKMGRYGTVFVARRTATGFMMARPCATCQAILRAHRVQRVYYSIRDDEYGVIDFTKKIEKRKKTKNA